MGKYNSDELFKDWNHSAESQYMQFIANELAETNRLKRIELECNENIAVDGLMDEA